MFKSILCFAVCLVLGACKSEESEKFPGDYFKNTPDLTGKSLVLKNTVDNIDYRVSPEGLKLLQSILNEKPDSVSKIAIPIFPSLTLEISGARYQIQPNELVYLGPPSGVWKHKGLRKELLGQSTRIKSN